MASNLIMLRKVWLLIDIAILWFISCSYSKTDENLSLALDIISCLPWIYFLIFPLFKEIFSKSLALWLGWFLGFDADGIGIKIGILHTFHWLKHVLFENHSFWLSEKPYMLMLIIFILMFFNWIFAQIILKVISYFRGKKDRLL